MFLRSLNKKFLLVALVVLLLVVFGFVRARVPAKEVIINFKNVEYVELSDITHSAHEEAEVVEKIFSSGQSIKLKEGLSYVIEYKGLSGYENGVIPINYSYPEEQLDIDPFYNQERLEGMVENELGEINNAIKKKYKKINLFKIEKGKLFRFGDWYATQLAYKGPYSPNSDNLKIVLEKTDEGWQVKTDPPNISLSKFEFPNIPEDVLRGANNSL